MKPIPFFLGLFFTLLAARAEPPALSLDAATLAALAHNPSLKEARAKWEATKQRVPQAVAWDDLKVSANTRLGRFVDVATNSFTDQMLSVEQMIPLSGKNQSRARIAAAEALGGLEELRRRELDVAGKTRAAFHRLAKDYALLDINRANEASLTQTLEISRARFEVGNQTQADVLTAEGELVRIIETRRDLQRALSDDETQLKVLMNRDPFAPLGKPAAVEPHGAMPPVERLRTLLLAQRPEVRMAEAAGTGAKARLELARREWIPDPAVSLGAQRYNGAAQTASEVTAGISFNVPWLNGKKYRAEEREAADGVEAAQRALEGARTEALGLLRDQLAKIETFHHHVELVGEKLLPNARQIVQAHRTNYESGKSSFLELVLAQRSLREVESMAREYLADYEIALAELEALVGADLHLFSPHAETSKRKSK